MDIEVASGFFNTSSSQLWTKITRVFDKELKDQYSLMRKDRFTVENIMKYLAGEQVSKIPQRNYNMDMQTKYLNFGPSFLYACHGNRYQHMKRWIRERLVYMDTLLDYSASTSDFITVRANRLGKIHLDMQTYIPMYLRIKFRDEENNAGTIVKRIARNETVRFDYTIPTGTDQEILIYGAKYIKNLGDLTNLRPTTILIANADKLTSIKCTSDRLISTDVSNCKLLQSIDFTGCSILGTGTQNTLTVDQCRYLKTLKLRGTSLTAVYTSLQGGNLEEIHYPKTIQSVNLVKQTNLKTINLPFTREEQCTKLANFEILDCPNVETLSLDIEDSEGETNTFASLKYVQTLSIKNSLKIKDMTFEGFNKLAKVKLENLYELETCGFDNMNNEGDIGTLRSIEISNCPKIINFTMNVTEPDKEIIFANKAIIDLTNAYSIKNIKSNASIKGLNTIILPKNIQNIIFERGEYGDGISDIKNLWSYDSYVAHKTDGYEGIDFSKLNVIDLDLTTCVYIPKAINFKASPIKTMVFAKYRQEKKLPPILVNGSLDVTNYNGQYTNMFKYMDLSNLEIICDKSSLDQTNFSYIFYQTKLLSNKSNIIDFTRKMKNARILDFMFAESDLDEPIEIVTTSTFSANYMYEDCINIVTLDNVVINDKCISAEGMFKKCINVKTADNMQINVTGNVPEFFKDCTAMTSVSLSNPLAKGKLVNMYAMFNGCSKLNNINLDNLDTSGVNTLYGTFDGCSNLVSINLSKCDFSNVQNTSTMFQACSSLLEIDLSKNNLSNVNTASYMFHFCSSLIKVNLTGCEFNNLTNIYCMFRMSSLKEIQGFVIPEQVNNYAECFSGCPLESTTGLVINADILGGDEGLFFKNEAIKNINDITINENITNLSKAFKGCTSLTKDIRIPSHVTNVTEMFMNCKSLIDVTSNWNNHYNGPITSKDCYKGCTAIERIDGVYAGLENIPSEWGGNGVTSLFTKEGIKELKTNEKVALLYIPSELKNRLSEEELASIAHKNWTIV